MHKGSSTGGKLDSRMPGGGGGVFAHSYGKLKLNAKTLEFEMKIRNIAVVCISAVN